MKATYQKHILNFKQPGGTSRGVLRTKETYFLILTDDNKIGYGECALFRGLSSDDRPDYEEQLKGLCRFINNDPTTILESIKTFPSIQFGFEQALRSLQSQHPFELFPSKFTKSKNAIAINGLVWMGNKQFMKRQIIEKLRHGFSTIKMKIGAIDFNTELELIRYIRNEFSGDAIELRVDANGGFQPEEALEKLKELSNYEIHSIEQPIQPGQFDQLAELCLKSPIPIALDEELIGVHDVTKKEKLLQIIRPQFVILKPSLVGGFKGSSTWISLAEKYDAGWWVTSALESNIGLNAIAQWTYTLKNPLPQGLGTGGLFTNNIPSPLFVDEGYLWYGDSENWDSSILENIK